MSYEEHQEYFRNLVAFDSESAEEHFEPFEGSDTDEKYISDDQGNGSDAEDDEEIIAELDSNESQSDEEDDNDAPTVNESQSDEEDDNDAPTVNENPFF